MTYFAHIPSPALQAGRPPERLARPPAWDVPVEMALELSLSPLGSVIRGRFRAGRDVEATASVILDRGRFYATAFYADGHRLFLPLRTWTLESGR